MSSQDEILFNFLSSVFSPGDEIRIEDADGNIISSSDLDVLTEACLDADDPWIDLVTEAGVARGLFLPGDATVVDPVPSYRMPDGMIYLLEQDAPIEGEPHSKHMLPLSFVLDFPTPVRYRPEDLTISTPGSEMEIVLSQGRNRSEYQGKWKPVRSVFGQFADALQLHKEGPKDGPCFLQGECAGGTRKAAAMIANYIIGVDLDSGAPLEDVMESIIESGLEAVIYTTHSHLKSTSQIKRDYFLKWSDGEDPTPELCAEFLQTRRGVVPEVLEGLTILDDAQHTEEGVVILVQHKPMPKFRAVFPLAEPFVFAKRGGTQQDAIAEWKERYAGFASTMGFFFDETCVDPARLFYLPRHKKGDVHGSWWIAGKPVNLDNYDRVKMRRDRKGMKRATPSNAFTEIAGGADEESDADRYMIDGFNLMAWAKKAAKKFEIEALIESLAPDMLRDPRTGKPGVHVECPFEGDHSSLGGGGTFVVNASDNYDEGYDGGFTFTCVHNSCYGRDRLDFIKGCIEEGWFTVEDLKAKTFMMELEDDEEEEEEPRPAASKTEPAKKADEPVYEEGVDVDDEETRKLNALNRQYAVVVNGSTVKILKEPVGDSDEDDISFLTQSDVALFERNNLIFIQGKNGKTEAMEAFKAWLAWEKRRTYRGVTFSPGKDKGPHIYNLFRGFPYQPIKGDWSILRGHIYENICESDDMLFDWFMSWMAQLIQNPDRKPGSTLVVTGEKGTGKSTTFDYLSKLLGDHAISVSQRRQIVGNFNSHIATALLMVCEEAFWAADPQAEGVLKDLITNPTTLIEKKGYDPIKSENFTRLVLISNNDWVVPATLNDERRFGVFRCSNTRRGDIDFFERLRKQMDEEGGLEAMMYELLHYQPQTGSFGCLYNPPKTKHLQQQQVESLHGVDKFMLSLMHTGTYEPTHDNIDAVELNDDKPTLVYAVTLRACVEDFMRMRFQSEKAKTSYDDVAQAAKSWFDAEDFMLDVENGMNRKRTIRFPALNEARSKLKERKGIEIEFLARETVESKGRR